jgi:hypothetical protein
MPILHRAALGICAPLALAAAASAQSRAEPDYPLEAVLTAARQLCASAPTVEAAARGPLPAGWKLVLPARGSWLAQYLRENEQVASGFTAEADAFTATVRGRALEAIVSTSKGPPLQLESTTCEVMDRDAILSPDDARIGRWAGRPPALGRRDYLPGLYGWAWKPGLHPGSGDTTVNYVTASAAEAAGLRTGLTYLAITLSRQTSK